MKNSSAMRGGAIILVILIMLSLSVFGVLAMVSAHADYVLTQKRAAWVARYYELDALGQKELLAAREAAESGDFYDLDMFDGEWELDGSFATKVITLPETEIRVGNLKLKQRKQELRIVLEYVGGGKLRVVEWSQMQEAFDFIPDENNVWIPGE